MMLAPRSVTKVVFCIMIVDVFSLVLSAAVHLSTRLSAVVLSWRGWNGARTLNNQMPSGSRSFIRDRGRRKKNMMTHLLRILFENGKSSMHPTRPPSESRPRSLCGTNKTGPQRAIGESLPLTQVMNLIQGIPRIITAWPRSLRH